MPPPATSLLSSSSGKSALAITKLPTLQEPSLVAYITTLASSLPTNCNASLSTSKLIDSDMLPDGVLKGIIWVLQIAHAQWFAVAGMVAMVAILITLQCLNNCRFGKYSARRLARLGQDEGEWVFVEREDDAAERLFTRWSEGDTESLRRAIGGGLGDEGEDETGLRRRWSV